MTVVLLKGDRLMFSAMEMLCLSIQGAAAGSGGVRSWCALHARFNRVVCGSVRELPRSFLSVRAVATRGKDPSFRGL